MDKPKVGEKYKHFKGNTITIIALAKDTEDLKEMVVYEHDGETWVRPLDMFMSKVDKDKYPNVEQEYRFEKIDN